MSGDFVGQRVRMDVSDGIGTVVLCHPERRNALDKQMILEIEGLLRSLNRRHDVRVIVLTGEGATFCSGVDISGDEAFLADAGPVQGGYALQEAVTDVVLALRAIPQPVVAAVAGAAVGGGMSIAMAADIRVLDETAFMVPAFVGLGASGGDMGSSWLLPKLVGPERAAEILYTGRRVGASEAHRLGLCLDLVEEGCALQVATRLAEQMASTAPFSLRMTKSLLNLAADGLTLVQQAEVENRTQTMMAQTADLQEGLLAFREKRRPVFHDR